MCIRDREQAKAAWLAKLDNEPSWTTVAPPAPAVYEASPAPVYANPEDAAKAAWLASLDNEPVWTVGAPAPAPLPPVAEMSGSVAPTGISAEDAAKAKWLAMTAQ